MTESLDALMSRGARIPCAPFSIVNTCTRCGRFVAIYVREDHIVADSVNGLEEIGWSFQRGTGLLLCNECWAASDALAVACAEWLDS